MIRTIRYYCTLLVAILLFALPTIPMCYHLIIKHYTLLRIDTEFVLTIIIILVLFC